MGEEGDGKHEKRRKEGRGRVRKGEAGEEEGGWIGVEEKGERERGENVT